MWRWDVLITGPLLIAACTRTQTICVPEWMAMVWVQLTKVIYLFHALILAWHLHFFIYISKYYKITGSPVYNCMLFLCYSHAPDGIAAVFWCVSDPLICTIGDTHLNFCFLDISWHYLYMPGLQYKHSLVPLLRVLVPAVSETSLPKNKCFWSKLFGVAPCWPIQPLCL